MIVTHLTWRYSLYLKDFLLFFCDFFIFFFQLILHGLLEILFQYHKRAAQAIKRFRDVDFKPIYHFMLWKCVIFVECAARCTGPCQCEFAVKVRDCWWNNFSHAKMFYPSLIRIQSYTYLIINTTLRDGRKSFP